MRNWLWVIATTGLMAGVVQAGDVLSHPKSDLSKLLNRVTISAQRVGGRVMGSLVRKGMTEEQVERLLGKNQKPLPTGGIVGNVVFCHWTYYDYGLTVHFLDDEAGVLRVSSVTLSPFFE